MRKHILGQSRYCKLLLIATALLVCFGCGNKEVSKTANDTGKNTGQPKTMLEVLAGNCTIDQFHINGIHNDPGVGQIFFAHPYSQCAIPAAGQSGFVRFYFGILDGARLTSPKTGGVEFRLSAENSGSAPKLLWSRSLDPVKNAFDRGQQQAILRIDGSGTQRITLETKPISGPLNNWSYWSKVSLTPEINYLSVLNDGKLLDQFGIDGLRSEGPLGNFLFAHPHSQFYLPVVKGMRSVHFHFGILDNALTTSPKPEGVKFRIILETSTGQSTLWSRALKPATVEADRGPHESAVTLKDVDEGRLVFETLLLGKPENNWSYWSEVGVE